ncbi:MAG: hypothetical protein LBF70_02315 [Holosporales bacterium]|jgi:outer membrane lipoprotein-sorting protein|nr:hypothetical protein [Holosporales bacterium]
MNFRTFSLIAILTQVAFAQNNVKTNDAKIVKDASDWLSSVKYIKGEFIQTTNSGDACLGRLWISTKDKKIKIVYTSGPEQEININDKYVVVTKEGKKYNSSIGGSPIYSILCGTLDISKEKFEVLENSKDTLRIKINKFGDVILVFSKYPNGNIKTIIAWIIDGILCSLDPESIRINDPKEIPHEWR